MLPPPAKGGESASVLVDADQSQRGYNAPAVAIDDNTLTIA
jgi:hypothetical protein